MEDKEELKKSPQYKEAGERFQAIRTRLGLKQVEMSEKLEISNTSYHYIEAGKQAPTFELIQKLHRDFNVNLDYIFTGKGELFIDEDDSDYKTDILALKKRGFEAKRLIRIISRSRIAFHHIISQLDLFLLNNQDAVDKQIEMYDMENTKEIKE